MIDLHTHTLASDGSLTPTELYLRAERLGLDAIALTDHNSSSGLCEFLNAARGGQVRAIAGVEFSTDHLGHDLHIIALDLDIKYFPVVTDMMDEYQRLKTESNIELVRKLRAGGYDISYEELVRERGDGKINRGIIGTALVDKGYFSSVPESFEKVLGFDRGFYTPPRRISSLDAIRLIKSWGAIAIWAHPFLNFNEEQVRKFLELALPCGLDAMEVFYPTYDELTTSLALSLTREYGILPSGGSDFHGKVKPDIELGVGRGDLNIPISVLDDLLSLKK